MSVVELRPDRVELLYGTVLGKGDPRWFAILCEGDVELIVADRPTEAEARADVEDFGLPIIVLRCQSTSANI